LSEENGGEISLTVWSYLKNMPDPSCGGWREIRFNVDQMTPKYQK